MSENVIPRKSLLVQDAVAVRVTAEHALTLTPGREMLFEK